MPLFDSFLSKSPPAPPPSSVPSISAVGVSVGAAVGAVTQRVKLPNFGKNLFRDLQASHVYLLIGAASLSTLVLIRAVSGSQSQGDLKPIPSPRETLPPEVLRASPYPPDALEGARDVQTPYGSIRVYEWGPKDGKRVLLIHGMSTPSVALSDLAHKLVKKGYRVMLFGMFYIRVSELLHTCDDFSTTCFIVSIERFNCESGRAGYPPNCSMPSANLNMPHKS